MDPVNIIGALAAITAAVIGGIALRLQLVDRRIPARLTVSRNSEGVRIAVAVTHPGGHGLQLDGIELVSPHDAFLVGRPPADDPQLPQVTASKPWSQHGLNHASNHGTATTSWSLVQRDGSPWARKGRLVVLIHYRRPQTGRARALKLKTDL